MYLKFEKNGKSLFVEKKATNVKLQIADYVMQGYTFIEETAEFSEKTAPETEKQQQSTEQTAESAEETHAKVKRFVFRKDEKLRIVNIGVANYLNLWILFFSLAFINSIFLFNFFPMIPNFILDKVALVVFVIAVIKMVEANQQKLVGLNLLIIYAIGAAVSVVIPLIIFGPIMVMIAKFIFYLVMIRTVHDMSNQVNRLMARGYLVSGYEIVNRNEITDEDLAHIQDETIEQPFWQIIS